tara:strand:- start:118 stop:456 length:339 start_codon:yes stop_codon:yes gene_type:complete
MKRLTVHVTNQPRVDTNEPVMANRKTESKSSAQRALDQGAADRAGADKDGAKGKKGRFKVYTTITVRDLKDTREVNDALADIRKKYTVAICTDSRRSNWKPGDEMYHIANQK